MKKTWMIFLACFFCILFICGCTEKAADADPNETSVKVLEENTHYKLMQIGYGYAYEIYDSDGNVIDAKEFMDREPRITMINDHLLQWITQAGTGTATNWGYYFDYSGNQKSQVFQCIYDASDTLVCHGGGSPGVLVVENIFDKAQYELEIRAFAHDFSPAAEPILSAVFSEDSTKLTVTYLSGEDYEEVTEIFDLR